MTSLKSLIALWLNNDLTMMDIRKLRLTGFKSFVDPTELVVDAGLTGVVGPNGCGKSNLLEALRWAMGENRAKTMRGEGMEDVIFAGTDKRAAKSYAEVSVILRNTTSLHDEDTELQVSRRIQRGAGSVYRLNGRETRARDVQHLFVQSGSGAHSSSLVRQGQIAQIIQAKPMDRRIIIEEAAGIGGLQSRRREAELKLKQSQDNLSEIQDLEDNLTKQIQSLQRQAKQALRYRELSDDIRVLERSLFILRLVEQRNQQLQTDHALRTTLQELSQARADHNKQKEAVLACDEALEPMQKEQQIATTLLATAQFQSQQCQEQIRTYQARLQQLQTEAARLQADQEAWEQDHHAIEEEREHIEARLQHVQLQQQHGNDEALVAEITKLTEQLAEVENRLSQMRENRAIRRHQSTQHKATQDKLHSELRRLSKQLEQAQMSLKQAQHRLQELEQKNIWAERLTEIDQSLQNLNKEKVEFQSQQVTHQEELTQKDNALSEARKQHESLQAQRIGLEKLITAAQPEREDALAHLIHVDEVYAEALAAGLGQGLEAGADDVKPGAFWLPSPPKTPAMVDSLSAFVQAPEYAQTALNLGRVRECLADAVRDASQLKPGEYFVTRKGDIVRFDGLVIPAGGNTAQAAFLKHSEQLRQVKKQLKEAVLVVQNAQKERDDVHKYLQQLRDQLHHIDRIHEALIREQHQQHEALLHHERQLSTVMLELKNGEQECIRLEKAVDGTKQQLIELEKTSLELENPEHEDAAISDAQCNREAIQARRLKFQETLTQRQGERRAYEQNLSECMRQKELVEKRAQQHEVRQESLKAAYRSYQSRKQELGKAPPEHERIRLEKEIGLHKQRLDQAEKKLADIYEERQQWLETGQQLATNIGRLTEKKNQLIHQKEEIAASLAKAYDESLELYRTSFDDLLHTYGVPEEDVETLEILCSRKQREREAMGPVNLRADLEIEELSEHKQTMTGQREELETVIAQLHSAIQKLNREGDKRLQAAFDRVNNHFQSLFQLLFEGGEASLTLIRGDDPLDVGIDIHAQPPGKKTKAMTLLSGGEQTLTALALIFAVFLTNPSPICVLDEVDAPLDDANVDRFCRMVRNISRQTGTKFLIITHHPLTMARMDRLYGVTMAERGVSQLVTVDLHAATAIIKPTKETELPQSA
ncbi:MAG: hypothetical protein EBT20_00140 [Alphaproteobacteria bacterium]|nr:hypothetical protein [Alphaproteobacteria bacterium]